MSGITLLRQFSTHPSLVPGCLTVLGIGVSCAAFPPSIAPLAAAFFSSAGHRLYHQARKPGPLQSDMEDSNKTKEPQTEMVRDISKKTVESYPTQTKASSSSSTDIATTSPLIGPYHGIELPSNPPTVQIHSHDPFSLTQLPPRTVVYYPITFEDKQEPYSTLTKDIRRYQDALQQILFLDKFNLDQHSVFREIETGTFENKEAALLEYCIFHPENYGCYQLEYCILKKIRDKKPEIFSPFLNAALIIRLGRNKEEFLQYLTNCSAEEKRKLALLAHILAEPQFFSKADAIVTPEQYELNFLWLCDQSREDSLIKPEQARGILFDPVSRWAFYNPQVPINIWYDSKVVSKRAIESTRESLLQVIKEVPGIQNSSFHFLDIRMIEETRKTERVFSSQIPLFFRIDLLKALILENRVSSRKYVVFSDLDVAAMPSQALFDRSILKHLSEFGMVMGKSSYTRSHENSFFILSQHPTIQKFQRDRIIHPSLQEAAKKLAHSGYDLDPQKVFGFYCNSLAKDRTKAIQVPRSQFDLF